MLACNISSFLRVWNEDEARVHARDEGHEAGIPDREADQHGDDDDDVADEGEQKNERKNIGPVLSDPL
jgi:hypothetical protein